MIHDSITSSLYNFLFFLSECIVSKNDLSYLSQCDWVIEILVVNKPLICKISASISNKSLVNRKYVFHSSLI